MAPGKSKAAAACAPPSARDWASAWSANGCCYDPCNPDSCFSWKYAGPGERRREKAPASAAAFPPRAVSFDLMVGRNGPAGDLAVGLAVDVTRHIALAAAVGVDERGEYFRAALSSRLRLRLFGPLFGEVSLGVSYGSQTERGASQQLAQVTEWIFSKHWAPQYRADPEIGLSLRFIPRLAIRAFGGLGIPLNSPSCSYFSRGGVDLSDVPCNLPEIPRDLQSRDHLFPYAGVAVSAAAASLGSEPQEWGGLQRKDRWYGWQNHAR